MNWTVKRAIKIKKWFPQIDTWKLDKEEFEMIYNACILYERGMRIRVTNIKN